MRCCDAKKQDVERAFSHAAVSRFGEQQAQRPRYWPQARNTLPMFCGWIEIDVIPWTVLSPRVRKVSHDRLAVFDPRFSDLA